MAKLTKTNGKQFSQRTVFKKTTLAACVMAATASMQANAQDEAAALEEVVVYGTKASLQNAQDIKREAATVKDVITASDIGALPDKSVVEALQRVPGVAIERFEASDDPDHFSVEGGNVTVRGLNRVRNEINGRDTFSAGNDGGMNFSDIPPGLLSSVEVAKNQTADLIEGGVAGTVNIITRKPFDKDELVMSATVKASYDSLAEETTPDISGIISNVWDTDSGKWGALLSISASSYESRGDGIGVYNFYPITGTDVIAPNAGSARQQFNDRDRLGIASSLQWANPSETVQATLEFIRSDSTVAWNERFLEFPEQPFSGNAGSGALNIASDLTYDCPEGNGQTGVPCQFTSGTFINGDAPWGAVPYIAGSRLREDERVINDISLNVEYAPNDNLTVWADFQFVDATNDIIDNTAHGKFFSDTYLDIRHPDEAKFEFLNDDVDQSETYFYRSAMDHTSENEGEETAFQLDAEYQFDDSFVTAVKGGVRFSNREVTIREGDYSWGNVSETWATGGEAEFSDLEDSGAIEQFTFEDHMHDSALQGNSTFWFPSISSLSTSQNLYDTLVANNINLNPDGWVPLHMRSGVVAGTSYLPSEIYVTEEDRTAAYVRVDFGNEDADMRYSGNFGLRYVSWQLSSTGASNFPTPPGDDLIASDADRAALGLPPLDPTLPADVINYANEAGGIEQTIEGEEFTRVLPSFNFKLELTEDLIFRLAMSEGIFLPTLDDVRNTRNVGMTNDVLNAPLLDSMGNPVVDPATGDPVEYVTGVEHVGFFANGAGNPYLQPEVSSNYDIAFEWYFADLGSLTSTFFYKRVRDYFREATVPEDVTNPSNGITQTVQSTKTVNAGSAVVQGYEIALQSDLSFINENLEAFGFQTSYTFIDGTTEDRNLEFNPTDDTEATFRNFSDLPLEGLSQDNYNIVLFYDNSTFQTRFAYSWRSDYLLNSRDVIAFSPVYGESTGQLDWSASFQITDEIKVGLEASNLLNEVTKTSIQYNQDGVKTPRSYFSNDRRFALSITGTF